MVEWLKPIKAFFKAIQPRKLRSMVDWAESEIILPSGPRKGERLNYSYAPYTKLLIEQLESNKYRRFWLAGSVQSGKTLLCFVLPILYHLLEYKEDVIVLLPNMELAHSIFNDKILPVILANPKLRSNLPEGFKQAGRNTDVIRFANGAQLRFIGAGGNDAQRSSHTARIVVVSEADKMDCSGDSSDETDPLRQAESRSTSFSDRARIFAECTVSTKTGRIWQESQIIGTGTKVYIPCPYCNMPIYPEREQLKGWEEDNVNQAREKVYYECQNCNKSWNEKDRQTALQSPMLVHKTQHINENGEIVGDEPDTNTFGLIYNCFHSPLLTMSDIAEKEWSAKKHDTEDARRELTQFLWSQPYESEDTTTYSLEKTHLLNLIANFNRGEIPDTDNPAFMIASVDVQKEWIWLMVTQWQVDMTCRVIWYDAIEIVPKHLQHQEYPITPDMVYKALDEARDTASQRFGASALWIDVSYSHEASSTVNLAKQWTIGKQNIFPVRGRAHTVMQKMGKSLPLGKLVGNETEIIQARKQGDGSIDYFLDVDKLKDLLYEKMMRAVGTVGSINLPIESAVKPFRFLLDHLSSEKQSIKTMRDGSQKRTWIKKASKRRSNDLWDTLVYSLAAAIFHIRYGTIQPKATIDDKPKPKQQQPRRQPRKNTRASDKYGRY